MTAPLQATNVDNKPKQTGGLYRVEIDTAPGNDTDPNAAPAPGGWVEILGISEFNPSDAQSTEDDSTVATGAHGSQFPIGQQFVAEIKGFVMGEQVGGVYTVDPGLGKLLDCAKSYGFAGIAHIRYWRTDGDPEARAVYTTTEVKKDNVKAPALATWSGTLTGRGAPVVITKPTGSITKIVTIGSGVTEYTVTVDGQTTASISTMTSAALRTALEALSNVGAGNVTVTGSSGGPLTVEFSVPVTVVTASGTGGTVTIS